MTANPNFKLQISELHHQILLLGLGTAGATVIPYPSSEYVRRNLLSGAESNPLHKEVSDKNFQNPAFKGDKTWELIGHWYAEGLQLDDFEDGASNPLEHASLRLGELLRFLESSDYALPAWISRLKNSDFQNPQQLLDSNSNATGKLETRDESTDLRRFRRTLAALAIGLAGKHHAYSHGEKPNVSKLAEVATGHLRNKNARTAYGFSDKTARDTITEALKAFNELAETSKKAD